MSKILVARLKCWKLCNDLTSIVFCVKNKPSLCISYMGNVMPPCLLVSLSCLRNLYEFIERNRAVRNVMVILGFVPGISQLVCCILMVNVYHGLSNRYPMSSTMCIVKQSPPRHPASGCVCVRMQDVLRKAIIMRMCLKMDNSHGLSKDSRYFQGTLMFPCVWLFHVMARATRVGAMMRPLY